MRKIVLGMMMALLPFLSHSAFAANREAHGISHWENGSGNCGANQGVGGGGNGTGYIADFKINTMAKIEDTAITFHFVGYNGKEFFGPLTGPLGADGSFDAKARNDKYDEEYNYKGKLSADGSTGTFTRQAHCVGTGNSGARCTATWSVTFKEGATAPTPASAPAHPTTVSKPPK